MPGLPDSKSLFSLAEKSNQREGDPGAPPLRGSLDISPTSGAAQLALARHTKRASPRSSDSARLNLRLLAKYRGGAQGKEKLKFKITGWSLRAHPAQLEIHKKVGGQMSKAVCFECIDDLYLKEIIKEEGALLECSVCGNESNNAFSIEQLGKLLEPIMREHFLPGDSIKEFGEDDDEWWTQEGEPMSWAVQLVLDQYFDFADEIVDAVIEAEDVGSHDGVDSFWDKTSNYVEKRVEAGHFFYEWESTLEELKHSRRFFSPAAQNLFGRLFDGVEDLKAWNGKTFLPVVRRLPVGTKLFRARICKSSSMLQDILEDPFRHVGPPPKEHAQAGRMNPEGVNVFYGAREVDTCLAETRPALGSDVAIITLMTTKSIRVLDFSRLEQSRGGKALSYFQPDYEEQVNKRDFLQHARRVYRPAN